MSKKINLQGSILGKLTVLTEADPSKMGDSRWLCQCECGNVKIITTEHLRSGNTKSCGCLRKRAFIRYNANRRNDAILTNNGRGTGFRGIINQYKHSARRKKIVWELTDDDVAELTKCNCYYCGRGPSQNFKDTATPWIHNGIDRIDSSLGYTKDNTLPCCSTCNYMKLDRSMDEFKSHIIKISEYQLNKARL